MIITIDGPTASGKSSIAKLLAARLGIHCLNTGLLYRAFAYLLKQRYGKSLLDEGCFGPLNIDDQDLTMINHVRYEYIENKPTVFYQEQDITQHLFDDTISQLASMVSAYAHVRQRLLPLQRDIAEKYDVIADGRDCGTVVFPDADFKFYLTASVDVRAQRRFSDFQKLGSSLGLEAVVNNLKERDERDMHREVAPLVVPPGAIVIDSSDMTIDQTIKAFLKVIEAGSIIKLYESKLISK